MTVQGVAHGKGDMCRLGTGTPCTVIPGFLEHCEERWRYVQAADSGAIDREMERRLWFWAIRRYGHPAYRKPSPSRRNIGASQEKKKVFKNFLIASCLVLIATVASAQTITKWTSRVYNVGAAVPLSAPVDFVIGTNVTCGVDPSTVTATPANPLKAVWDDPEAAGKVCVYTDPGNGPLLSTPFGGSFEATLTATNSAGTSPESARAPFTHPGLPPSAPTGLRLGK